MMEEGRTAGSDDRTDACAPPHSAHVTRPELPRVADARGDRRRQARHNDAAQDGRLRWHFALLAYGCVALAVLGVVLPGLPTTPFVLAAAWSARRGCPSLDRWLRTHRRLGPLLHHWETRREVPPRAKLAMLVLLAMSWALLAAGSDGPLVPGAAAVGFVAIAVFVTTRRSPAAEPGSRTDPSPATDPSRSARRPLPGEPLAMPALLAEPEAAAPRDTA